MPPRKHRICRRACLRRRAVSLLPCWPLTFCICVCRVWAEFTPLASEHGGEPMPWCWQLAVAVAAVLLAHRGIRRSRQPWAGVP